MAAIFGRRAVTIAKTQSKIQKIIMRDRKVYYKTTTNRGKR